MENSKYLVLAVVSMAVMLTSQAVNAQKAADFKMTNIGIGAGYGYNYVPKSSHRGDWLIHFSVLPTLLVYTNSSITIGETDTRRQGEFLQLSRCSDKSQHFTFGTYQHSIFCCCRSHVANISHIEFEVGPLLTCTSSAVVPHYPTAL